MYEKSYMSPRPPPKISLRHDHDWTKGNDKLGSTVEQQPVGKLVQQSFGEVQCVKLSAQAVANMCEESESHQDRSGQPDVLMGQSIVLSEIKAEVPLQNDDPSLHKILW